MDDPETNDHVEPSVFGDDDDDPFAVPPPLASLSPEENPTVDVQVENGVLNLDGENDASEQDKQKNKTKRKALRPRVNLNETRLCSEKGIAALKNLCADVQFKGKGHEASDLNKLLQQFEHWAQCLMPSWPFENVVKKCEKLGTKRSVQNELKRLRRDEDDILRGDSEDEQEEPAVQGETTTNDTQQDQQEPEPPQPEVPVELTEEQLERIRKNRELALARKEALRRRKQQQESQNHTLETATEEYDTSNHPNGSFVETLSSDQNDRESVGATERQMDESSNEEQNQNNYDENNIAGSTTDQMDTDTNMDTSESHQSENRRATENTSDSGNIIEINKYTYTNTATLEIPLDNGSHSEKLYMINGEHKSPDMIAANRISQMGKDETAVELPVNDGQRSKEETDLLNNKKENSDTIADETDPTAVVAVEKSGVLTSKHVMKHNPNLENGETETQEILADHSECIVTCTSSDEVDSVDQTKKDGNGIEKLPILKD